MGSPIAWPGVLDMYVHNVYSCKYSYVYHVYAGSYYLVLELVPNPLGTIDTSRVFSP